MNDVDNKEILKTPHDNCFTETFDEQFRIESMVRKRLQKYQFDSEFVLRRKQHITFCEGALKQLPSAFDAFDASQPWLVYWNFQALDVLEHLDKQFAVLEPGKSIADTIELREFYQESVVAYLSHRQCSSGGFAGAPFHEAHLAPTYAAINTCAIIGTDQVFQMINRKQLYSFLMRQKHWSGGFSMHDDGEVDVRGTYCALSVATLCNIATLELLEGVLAFLHSCQSYEGGIAGTPNSEAHGAYSFCGLSAFLLAKQCYQQLNRMDLFESQPQLDLHLMMKWVVFRQMPVEGGFNGRTNKLVDACYSWWQGSVVCLLQKLLEIDMETDLSISSTSCTLLSNQLALQRYVLGCCQDKAGGCVDKPGKQRDFYHTCYALSGVAASQHGCRDQVLDHQQNEAVVLGNARENRLPPVHLLHCVRSERVQKMMQWFKTKDE